MSTLNKSTVSYTLLLRNERKYTERTEILEAGEVDGGGGNHQVEKEIRKTGPVWLRGKREQSRRRKL